MDAGKIHCLCDEARAIIITRRSILLGSTDMSRSEFQSFMEHLSQKYHGDTYHLIVKNCNHFTDDVCRQVTGKYIPGWVNRLAQLSEEHCLPFYVYIIKEFLLYWSILQDKKCYVFLLCSHKIN